MFTKPVGSQATKTIFFLRDMRYLEGEVSRSEVRAKKQTYVCVCVCARYGWATSMGLARTLQNACFSDTHLPFA